MIKIIPNKENFLTEADWLKSYHHFSFGEHYDSNKMNFGSLRVFNDDSVQPGKGFGFHSHQDMEIITYVTEGSLEHKDNFGNNGIVKEGEIQIMSAGTGVFHSEFNHSQNDLLKFLQIWISPEKKELKPFYSQKSLSKHDRLNKLQCVISPRSDDSSLSIHQDVSFYVSRLENSKVHHDFAESRVGYLFVISGKLQINDMELGAKDSVKIQEEKSIILKSSGSSEIILLDMPSNYDSTK